MPDTASGWVQVRLIGSLTAVKGLAQFLASTHEVRADSGCLEQHDQQHRRTLTIRRRTQEATDARA